MRHFSASLDLLSKIITVFVLTLLVGMTFHFIYLYLNQDFPVWALIVSTAITVSIILVTYLFKTNGYQVGRSGVAVQRPIGDKVFESQNIKHVEVPTKDSMRWTIRTFGNGGLFGYWGKFRNSTYGNMTWFATKRSNYVLLILKDNSKIILTPDDTAMAGEIKRRLEDDNS